MMFPKSKPVRDKAWRQRVAEMPCAGCGLEGSSQAAHARGLGMGIKASDHLCIPLCCARPGVEGCHAAYDRCRAFPGRTRDETKAIVEHLIDGLDGMRIYERKGGA
jgi:hypothetical protein